MMYNKDMKGRLKKCAIHASAFTVVMIIATSVVAAANIGDNSGRVNNPIQAKSLQDLFNNIVSVLIELGTIVSVLGIMYGGFLYVTAQGNQEKLGTAYKTITWALVGTAVLLGARTIMAAVRSTVDQLGTGVS